jgi:hypothetical protein
LKNPEDHKEINHSVAKTPCGGFGLWVWPEISSPVIDTTPPWCGPAPSKTEGDHVPR